METMKKEIESQLGMKIQLEKRIEEIKSEAEGYEQLRATLKQQADFYREENAKMEATLRKLHLLSKDLDPWPRAELNRLVNLQEKYESKRCTAESIGLSYAECQREQNSYMTKVKGCIKVYNDFIEKLNKEIKNAKYEHEQVEERIISLLKEDFNAFELKVEKYEKELLKFEKKYPWLKDPQYNLQNISRETEILNSLKEEKDKLLQELEVYQNLKPNISEAMQQLAAVKQEYESIK
ncbi:hypothetical protein ILUMI_10492 [Ignelater luminosus]|uniref:Uncharacterized protein n=1 Tax=Ignelater luminosus TaxID=2038154 RepID=A0A8K0D2E0_IGNLU|nr:hypothetical protein ILUMI_10492 [Ignelater luminosus]